MKGGGCFNFLSQKEDFFDAIIILCPKAPGDEQITKFDRAFQIR